MVMRCNTFFFGSFILLVEIIDKDVEMVCGMESEASVDVLILIILE